MVTKAAEKKASEKALATFKERFEKSYGKDTLKTADTLDRTYTVVPSGSLFVDYALCTGGLIEGRLSEWSGMDDVGKTTLALIAVAAAQRKHPNRMVAYLDVENKLDLDWAEAHGVDLKHLFVIYPTSAEETADLVSDFLQETVVSMVVIDSVGAMIGRVEMEKQSDEPTIAIVARIMSRLVRAASAQARRHNAVVILINQLRSQINTGNAKGSSTTRTGGMALRFATTTRLKLSFTEQKPLMAKVGRDTIEVGREVAVKVERNKAGVKGRVAKVKLVSVATEEHGPVGIDEMDEAVRLGEMTGVIRKSGAWYYLDDGEKFQGIKNTADYLREHPDLAESIRERILATRASEVTDDLGEPLEEESGVEIVPEDPEASGGPVAVPGRSKFVGASRE